MRTLTIAPGVTQIVLAPRQAINAYLVDSVLVNAGIRGSQNGLLAALAGRPLTAHVLTHAHADHQGASAAICAARDVPLWCAEAERELAESGQVTRAYPNPTDPVARFQQRYWAGPGWPVRGRFVKETRSATSVSSRHRDTPLATWRSGASATACSSQAMCWWICIC